MPAQGEWKLIDCATNRISWPYGIRGMAAKGDVLIVSCFQDFLLFDWTDPTQLRELSRWKPKFGSTSYFRVIGHELLLVSDDGVEIVDITDPTAPRSGVAVAYKTGYERGGDRIGGHVYVTYKQSVAVLESSGPPSPLAQLPGENFNRYPTDLIAHEHFLYAVGRHDGLHVFAIEAPDQLRLLKTIKKGYAPTFLTWWVPGQVLMMVGDEAVIPVDVSTPAKAKQMKSCKIAGTELAPALARVGDRAMVAASRKSDRKSDILLVEIDCATPLAPTVLTKTRARIAERTDGLAGLVVRGDLAIVGGFYLMLKVFARS